MKHILLAGLVSLGLVSSAQAGMISTTFAGGNEHQGNMFDIEAFGNSLVVTGLTIHKQTTNTSTLEVYIKTGTYVGSESNAGDWTLVSSNSVTGAAGSDGSLTHGVGTFVDVTDFSLSANSITGIYVTFNDPLNASSNRMNYTNGSNVYSNADLELSLGVGKSYPFDSTFSPRTWNGIIHYDVVNAVPEPSTFALLGIGGLALVGYGWRRKRQQAA